MMLPHRPPLIIVQVRWAWTTFAASGFFERTKVHSPVCGRVRKLTWHVAAVVRRGRKRSLPAIQGRFDRPLRVGLTAVDKGRALRKLLLDEFTERSPRRQLVFDYALGYFHDRGIPRCTRRPTAGHASAQATAYAGSTKPWRPKHITEPLIHGEMPPGKPSDNRLVGPFAERKA